MIIQQSSSAHVCLRCQLRLLKRPALPNISHKAHRRGTRRQHNGTSPEPSDGPVSDQLGKARTYPEIVPIAERPHWDHLVKKVSKPRRIAQTADAEELLLNPLSRINRSRSHKLSSQSATLDAVALGKRSEVLILRDSKIRYTIYPPRVPSSDEAPLDKVDLFGQMNAERGLVGLQEVEKNIEELMPPCRLMEWEQLRKIEENLCSGFTRSQLSRYIQGQSKVEQKVSELVTEDGVPGSILRETAWMPGISEAGNAFGESAVRGYMSYAYTPKQSLVLKLLRECWNLEVKEVTESVGEMEMEIRSAELDLLLSTAGSKILHKAISVRLIEGAGEQVEVFKARRVIRITAKKERAAIIAEEIRNVLRGVHRIELDLDVLVKAKTKGASKYGVHADLEYDDLVMGELGRITDTSITKLSKNKILIAGVNRRPESGLSSSADVVRRYLLSWSAAADNTIKRQATLYTKGGVTEARSDAIHGLSWLDRRSEWVRWVSPTTKTSSSKDLGLETTHSSTTSGTVENPIKPESLPLNAQKLGPLGNQGGFVTQTKFGNAVSETRTQETWMKDSSVESLVLIGSVVHKRSNLAAGKIFTPGNDATQNAKFVPAIPNLSRSFGALREKLTLTGSSFSSGRYQSSVVLKFNPNPWASAGPETLEYFPPLEMRFKVNRSTQDLELSTVVAITEHVVSDVILPDRALDLRFQQTTICQLTESTKQHIPQLLQFLKASQLNLMRGPVVTPPQLTLPISKHLCRHDSMTGRPVKFNDDTVDVDYLFTSLEHRKIISFNFDEWMLRFTSIEGGKMDGRSTELSLHPHRPNCGQLKKWQENDPKRQEAESQEFIQTAYRLLDALENPGPDIARMIHVPQPVFRESRAGVKSFGEEKYFCRSITARNPENDKDDDVRGEVCETPPSA